MNPPPHHHHHLPHHLNDDMTPPVELPTNLVQTMARNVSMESSSNMPGSMMTWMIKAQPHPHPLLPPPLPPRHAATQDVRITPPPPATAATATLAANNNNNNNGSDSRVVSTTTLLLCSSCDRCRARKIKCDGQKPACGNCVNRYLKKQATATNSNYKSMKMMILQQQACIPFSECDCVYSPAKRRGPAPSTSSSTSSSPLVASTTKLSLTTNGVACCSNTTNTRNQPTATQTTTTVTNTDKPIRQPPTTITPPTSSSSSSSSSSSGCKRPYSCCTTTTTTTNSSSNKSRRSPCSTATTTTTTTAAAASMCGDAAASPTTSKHHRTRGERESPVQHFGEAGSYHHQLMQQPSTRNQEESELAGCPTRKEPVVVVPPSEVTSLTSDPFSSSFPRTLVTQGHWLEPSNPEAARLLSYYRLSIDELFRLPLTPTHQEHWARLQQLRTTSTTTTIPPSHKAALAATRFAELALGAWVLNEPTLSMELCHAVLHCLRESIQHRQQQHQQQQQENQQEQQHPQQRIVFPYPHDDDDHEEDETTIWCFEIAKAYFLLGVSRACRGDMSRYFNYRTMCMKYLSQTKKGDDRTATLLAAISFLDSWAYMIQNGNEKKVQTIEMDDDHHGVISTMNDPPCGASAPSAAAASCCWTTQQQRQPRQLGCNDSSSDCSSKSIGCSSGKCTLSADVGAVVTSNPLDKNWLQRSPPIYRNNEAPLPARALDAMACAYRFCSDQANKRFATIAEFMGVEDALSDVVGSATPSTTEVLAHKDECGSRNLIASAHSLMEQYESSTQGTVFRYDGLHLIISATSAFLDNHVESGNTGFTDSQIQSLVRVCNTAIDNPLLLHHAGPTYHMVTNAAVLLCHVLNGMHASRSNDGCFQEESEADLFDETLECFISVRRVLVSHRKKLPSKLRCHELPRPFLNTCCCTGGGGGSSSSLMNGRSDDYPVVDLGETLLCPIRGCQGFVLMACCPCVAAERAMFAEHQLHDEEEEEQAAAAAAALGERKGATDGAATSSTTCSTMDECFDEFDRELDHLCAQWDTDDDALLTMIGNLISV